MTAKQTKPQQVQETAPVTFKQAKMIYGEATAAHKGTDEILSLLQQDGESPIMQILALLAEMSVTQMQIVQRLDAIEARLSPPVSRARN